jgi:ribonuclease Z
MCDVLVSAPVVSQETHPAAPGAARRKVVVLGDTINSKPLAPLAAGADLLTHEATFAAVCGAVEHSRVGEPSGTGENERGG